MSVPPHKATHTFNPNEPPSLRFLREQQQRADEYRANGYRYSGRPNRVAEAPKLISAGELGGMRFNGPGWLIEGILPTGLAIIAGKSKIGKSWMVLDIAISVAAGRAAFGRINVTRSPVLYLALEDSQARLHDRQMKLLKGDALPGDLIYATEWANVDDGGLEMIEHWLDTNRMCRLVIVDTFGKIRGQPGLRTGAYQQDVQDLTAFKQLADRRGICLLLVHHTRKMESNDTFDQVSGTTGLIGTADTLMVLTRQRGEKLGTLSVTGRDIPDQGDLAVSFDAITGKWSILGVANEVNATNERRAITNLLFASNEPMSPAEIAAELGKSVTAIRMALSRMTRDGAVIKVGHGSYRAPNGQYDDDRS